MTFEDWLRAQIDIRAVVSVALGTASDGSHASLMTWSDKSRGTLFWTVRENAVEFMEIVKDEPNPAEICMRCMMRRDRHADDKICDETK